MQGRLLYTMSKILVSSPGLVLVTVVIVFLENNGLLKGSIGIDLQTGAAKTSVFSGLKFYKTRDHLGPKHFDILLNPCWLEIFNLNLVVYLDLVERKGTRAQKYHLQRTKKGWISTAEILGSGNNPQSLLMHHDDQEKCGKFTEHSYKTINSQGGFLEGCFLKKCKR